MTVTEPARVAVVGAGPAGLYAIEHLLQARQLDVEIDLIERLPTPWGLVRAGVAPDHQGKKSIIDHHFAYLMRSERVRFLGNVEVGVDLRHDEMSSWYDAVIYAVGAAGDVQMGVPGEGLPGCFSAREFVGFYNGHPDCSAVQVDLTQPRAVVIGNGNVALDVARVLTMRTSDLEVTDIADHALLALRDSNIREVVVMGRRGPLQAAFGASGLEELGRLEGVDIVLSGATLPTAAELDDLGVDWNTRRKVEVLTDLTSRGQRSGHRRIVLAFMASPAGVLGGGRVEQLRVSRNGPRLSGDGTVSTLASDEFFMLDTGLVIRSIGFKGTPFPGLPFDDDCGVIENCEGRVVDAGRVVPRTYVTGWIKRGCRGIIGSNKKCAAQTVGHLIEDLTTGRRPSGAMRGDRVLDLLRSRVRDVVLYEGWRAIDRAERDAGRFEGRPRVKVCDRSALIAIASAPSVH